jgi:hypothetical protein
MDLIMVMDKLRGTRPSPAPVHPWLADGPDAASEDRRDWSLNNNVGCNVAG